MLSLLSSISLIFDNSFTLGGLRVISLKGSRCFRVFRIFFVTLVGIYIRFLSRLSNYSYYKLQEMTTLKGDFLLYYQIDLPLWADASYSIRIFSSSSGKKKVLCVQLSINLFPCGSYAV